MHPVESPNRPEADSPHTWPATFVTGPGAAAETERNTTLRWQRIFYSTPFVCCLAYAAAGRCAFRNERTWRTATGIRSLGCFQGYMLTSAFGASIAASIATA